MDAGEQPARSRFGMSWERKEHVYAVEHWVAILVTLLLGGLCLVSAVLAYGAVQMPTWMGLTALVLLCVALYGRRAISKGSRRTIFFYGVALYTLMVLLVIQMGLLLINVNRGKEWVEENWYYLQTIVLPFTTELDTKRGISNNCMWILYAGILTVCLYVPPIIRAWEHVGGMAESSRAAMMFPLLLPQFALAGFVMYFGIGGVELTQFATPDTSLALSLSATAGVGHFLVAIVCFVAVLRRPDDPGSYLSGGLLASPLALVSIGAGINIMVQAVGVRSFVRDNWYQILQMLPPQYQQLSQEKYIVDAEDAFNFTGWLGLCLGTFSMIYVAFSVSVGYFMVKTRGYPGIYAASTSTPSKYGSGSMDAGNRGSPGPMPPRKSSDLTTPATPTPSMDGLSLRGGNGHPDDLNVDVRTSRDTRAKSAPEVRREENLRSRLVRGLSNEPAVMGDGTVGYALKTHFNVERNCCIITTVLCLLAFIGALLGIGFAAASHGKCGAVVRGPNAGYRMYNISYDHAELIQHINVFHSFPRGTSTIYLATSAESRNPKLRIKLELWGLSEADVTPPDNDVNPLWNAATFSNVTNILNVNIHPADLARVESDCLSATLVVYLPSGTFDASVTAATTHALNNVTQQVASEFPKFHALNITSGAGGISVNGLSASHNGRIVSDSGRVRVQTLSAVDMHVETTDSDLIAINVTSVNYVPLGLSNLTLIGHGDSNVIITDIVAANNATVRADDGNIIGVVAALGIEEDLDIQSNGKGGIFLSNFIMGSGAVARLTTTEGDIKVAAMTANTLFITTDSGEVNLYEVFIGMPKIFDIPGGYPLPFMSVKTRSGAIVGLGCGATPTSTEFASELVMHFETQSADIKVEVNGGGFAGTFECVTNDGDIVTSVHGDEAGANGVVGFGNGDVKLTSDTGDLELSMLPGPLGT